MKQILEKKELFHHEFSARHRHGEVNEVKTAAALVRWSPSKRCIDRLHRQTGRSTDNGATFFFLQTLKASLPDLAKLYNSASHVYVE